MMDSNKHREAATAGRFSAQYADREIAHLRHMIRCVNRDGAMNADYWRARMERLQLDAAPPRSDLPPSADAHEHARRLLEVLSLADAIPARRRSAVLVAPRLVSR